MNREPQPITPRLEKLLDDRDHLKIQISLEMDSPQPNEERLKALRHELSDVESQVRTQQ
jgi:hypothetical protein